MKWKFPNGSSLEFVQIGNEPSHYQSLNNGEILFMNELEQNSGMEVTIDVKEFTNTISSINQLAAVIHAVSSSKGFDSPNLQNIDKKLLLAVSEICEAQDELRDGNDPTHIYYKNYFVEGLSDDGLPAPNKPEGFPVEIADAIIRLLHICFAFKIDIAAVIAEKVAYNSTRPYKHGRKF